MNATEMKAYNPALFEIAKRIAKRRLVRLALECGADTVYTSDIGLEAEAGRIYPLLVHKLKRRFRKRGVLFDENWATLEPKGPRSQKIVIHS